MKNIINKITYKGLIYLGLILYGISYTAFSQALPKDLNKLIRIIDKKTGAPVEFATLSINQSRYFSANEHGEILLKAPDLKNADSLRISSVGYLSKTYKGVNNDLHLPDSIFLDPNVSELSEVRITAHSFKNVILGNKRLAIHGGFFTELNTQYALYVSNRDKLSGTIEELEINVTNGTNAIETPFKINVYSKGSDISKVSVYTKAYGCFPDKELINDDIVIYNPMKKRKILVDLRKYAVQLPEDGFFIVATVLGPEYYKPGVGATIKALGQDYSRTPAFDMTATNAKEDSYSMYFQGHNRVWYMFANSNFRFTAKVSMLKK